MFCCRVESEGPKSLAVSVSLLAPEVQVLDMPVDPNEPTYCLCHQVSHSYSEFIINLLLIYKYYLLPKQNNKKRLRIESYKKQARIAYVW